MEFKKVFLITFAMVMVSKSAAASLIARLNEENVDISTKTGYRIRRETEEGLGF